jgi:hypothetical protein
MNAGDNQDRQNKAENTRQYNYDDQIRIYNNSCNLVKFDSTNRIKENEL